MVFSKNGSSVFDSLNRQVPNGSQRSRCSFCRRSRSRSAADSTNEPIKHQVIRAPRYMTSAVVAGPQAVIDHIALRGVAAHHAIDHAMSGGLHYQCAECKHAPTHPCSGLSAPHRSTVQIKIAPSEYKSDRWSTKCASPRACSGLM